MLFKSDYVKMLTRKFIVRGCNNMQNITKQELITKVAKQTSYSKKDVSVILNTILNTIQTKE